MAGMVVLILFKTPGTTDTKRVVLIVVVLIAAATRREVLVPRVVSGIT